MRRWAALALFLTGCGASPLSLLTGGGPNVAANVQAAKTATQTVGSTAVQDQTIEKVQARDIRQTADTSRVKAEMVQKVVVQEYPPWLILAFAVALFLDSPLRWPEQVMKAFRRR